MRTILALLMVVAIAVPAFAGGNPNVTAFLTFDGAGADMPRWDPPAPFTQASVYLCLKNIDVGFTVLTIGVSETPGLTTGLIWQIFVPDAITLGDFPTGISITGSGCITDELFVVAAGTAFFMGGAGEISIFDHPDFPRWVVDCNDEVDFYCYETGVGVLMDPTPTGEDCAVSPVEDTTWGGIKALYR